MLKKLLIQMFLLFYATFSVALIAENASSRASTFRAASKSQAAEIGPHSLHPHQTRIAEHPFTGSVDCARSAPAESESDTVQPLSKRFVNDASRTIAPQSPPTPL